MHDASPDTSRTDPAAALFDVRNVTVDYASRGGYTRALRDVSLQIRPGQAIGVIGESGSGKTTLSRSMLGLIEPTRGHVLYRGRDVYAMGSISRFRVLSREAAMVFQDPRSSLNPRLSAGAVVRDPLTVLGIGTRQQRKAKVGELLESVGLAAELATRPVRALSGGQLQRLALARALAVEPSIIVADEPTSALDVSVQAQVLNLFQQIRARRHLALLLVSHDVRVVRFLADHVLVMCDGDVVERGATEQIYRDPHHDYTKALLAAAPRLRVQA
ncbi:ABC transporter ATP-binding protein [Actinobacteria bacterium YIM 96077]|uniref:Peptide ABC transporter ATP-binding protein n=1 Tax=Phytoactinopolyspora halophila TaxID=1981511 RepID=A0A329R2C5_9ACTN|nr:ABC transporter ATP-binding protein [Phytoactinopolyspora halophila]AYY11971.1 ABC transporter ATP-binding protein [Actinobacteria bacterium YIM 96077]RAW18795.1 peptide ABC transporter ATP-binding protein [Phytoactinopolyspora halophila]